MSRLSNRESDLEQKALNVNEEKQSASLEDNEESSLRTVKSAKKTTIMDKFRGLTSKYKSQIVNGILVILNILVFVYFGFATYYYVDKVCSTTENCNMGWCSGYGFLVILMILIYGGLIYFQIIKRFFGQGIAKNCLDPIVGFVKNIFHTRYARIGALGLLLAAFVTYMVFETRGDRDRLRGFVAIAGILFFGFLFSKHPSQIKWRPIMMGITLQFIMGLFCIRWEVGRSIFECIGQKVSSFLSYGFSGARFVYGDYLVNAAVLAFAGLSVIYFVSCMVSVMYYLGAMQWILMKMGWVLQNILGTTVCESTIAAANMFLGQADAPLIIRPYVKKLTHSELHAVMTSGFASASGAVMAVFIGFGANPTYIITATVMAVSGSLAVSKLFYPETEESQTRSENIQIEKSTHTSMLDAATNGSILAINIVLRVIANLISFVSIVAFFDGILSFFGNLVGFEEVSLVFLIGKVLYPVAWAMGVPVQDCEKIGQILALKTVINTIYGYQVLGQAIQDGEENPDVALHPRSIAICTFALCSFANPPSLGILIGSLGSMAPDRVSAITSVAVRALFSGICVCFITASIAGIVMPESAFLQMSQEKVISNFTNIIP
uniref:Putative concentrative na+-nucleoside cotransporter cnt1/cnt2 n=2 Tax=Nyssomyia neivai TaxID=330878 RepID=A0A1L8DE95_9DIPT